jgi:hypothetical protein
MTNDQSAMKVKFDAAFDARSICRRFDDLAA